MRKKINQINRNNGILILLTKSKKLPKAKQKTKGPARSVSSNISLLGVRNGFKTERVYMLMLMSIQKRKRKKKEKERVIMK